MYPTCPYTPRRSPTVPILGIEARMYGFKNIVLCVPLWESGRFHRAPIGIYPYPLVDEWRVTSDELEI